MTTTSIFPWRPLSGNHQPDMVIIAYTNSSQTDSSNLSSLKAADGNLSTSSSSSSSSSSWWWSDYPSGYSWPHIISVSIVITLVILVIIIGNFLVIWAISHDRTLKVTQNWFIASLACADLFIGILILPFSLTNELLGYWPFGVVFCEIYKAMDVLLCTASIISLCLISLDRYWSITRAVTYARQRTRKRATIMIFTVWFVSAVVSIPPLIGWNKPTEEQEWPLCMLSEDIGYVVYSSSGSFFIPAFIMVFVYGKIYVAAKKRARRTVKTKQPDCVTTDKTTHKQNSTESSFTEYRPLNDNNNANNCNNSRMVSVENNAGVNSHTATDAETTTMYDTLDTNSMTSDDEGRTRRQRQNTTDTCISDKEQECRNLLSNTTDSESNKEVVTSVNRYTDDHHEVNALKDLDMRSTGGDSDDKNKGVSVNAKNGTETSKHGTTGNGGFQQFSIVEIRANGTSAVADTASPAIKCKRRRMFSSIRDSLFPKRKNYHKNSPRKAGGDDFGRSFDLHSTEKQKKKLAKARERRATVVLGLVMAAFILCWLPFFVMYFVSAFCSDCIPPAVFKVFFWIGYFNSALNPIIYTVFNREFRRAFQKILFGRKNIRR